MLICKFILLLKVFVESISFITFIFIFESTPYTKINYITPILIWYIYYTFQMFYYQLFHFDNMPDILIYFKHLFHLFQHHHIKINEKIIAASVWFPTFEYLFPQSNAHLLFAFMLSQLLLLSKIYSFFITIIIIFIYPSSFCFIPQCSFFWTL